jgi:hypothetical protein
LGFQGGNALEEHLADQVGIHSHAEVHLRLDGMVFVIQIDSNEKNGKWLRMQMLGSRGCRKIHSAS